MRESTRLMMQHGTLSRKKPRAEPDAPLATGRQEIKTPPPKPYTGNTRVMDTCVPVSEKELQNPNSPYVVPSSWDAPLSVQKRHAEQAEHVRAKSGPKPQPKEKIRRTSISVCVSDEEEARLRAFVSSKGLNFSEWSRNVWFKAIGEPLPKRPVRT